MDARKLRGREEILYARIASIFVLATLLLSAPLAQAVPITIEITGNVTSASGSGLPGTIYAGIGFTGTYTYDSSTIDSGGGHYMHDAPYGIILSLGGYEFKTVQSHVGQFDMFIADNVNLSTDFYSVRSYENVSNPTVGFPISSIRWDLWDSTHTALDSDALPITAPVLTAWDHNVLRISGSGDLGGLLIEGAVTQAVPEPLTGVLMAVGAFILRRRR